MSALSKLSIRNFAIIDQLDMEFGPGFNVLTGETGAGKSILIGALGLGLGERADLSMIRQGCDRASVDLLFDLSSLPAIVNHISQLGYELEDGELLLSREIHIGGKSYCKIGGRPAAVSQLKELGNILIDLHGQHEHQSLLNQHLHQTILDSWSGKQTIELREQAASKYKELQKLQQEKRAIETESRERERLIDLYTFQMKEITGANLCSGEEEALETERNRAMNAQRLLEAAQAVELYLNNEDAGLRLTLEKAIKALEHNARLDSALNPIIELMRNAAEGLSDASHEISAYQEELAHNPENLERIEERYQNILRLKRKYGSSIDEILQYSQEAIYKLSQLQSSEERAASLDEKIDKLQTNLNVLHNSLTHLRISSGKLFTDSVQNELRNLAMEHTIFEVQITPSEPSLSGADRVEFMITVNPGEPLRPLSRVASGGEVSRIMLAIKSSMAQRESLPTMIFDEIDVGIGGRTAVVAAEKIASMSSSCQIICITHLSAIAGSAQHHFQVTKNEESGRTIVKVSKLDWESRIEEIARMLGGSDKSETALRHAREILSAGARN